MTLGVLMLRPALFALATIATGVSSGLMAAEVEGEDAKSSNPVGRRPWVSSKFRGSPDPPLPFRVVPAFARLRFEKPIALAAAKGLGRVFVAEVGGKVYSFPNQSGAEKPDLAIDLASGSSQVGQLFGLAFHPNFAKNRLAYLCYTMRKGGPDGTRVSSFRVEGDDPPRFAASSEKILITWPAGGHNAGCLAFGPDGLLYISAGDSDDPTPPDRLMTGQDLSDLLASILRIDVDHPEAGRGYRIPPDNPFVGLADARPEIWAFGFRNPWRFSFDRSNGDLWAGDVGWELWEMIHLVRKGGNHGWSIVEGPQSVHPEGRRGPGPIVPPVVVHPHSEAASMTGGYVYRGKALPDLVGVYVYGDYQSGKIWGFRHDGQKVTWRGELADTPLQLVSFGEDNDGEVYALDYERSQQVYKLVPNRVADSSTTFPKTLGQTGLFASVADQSPAPGVVPYAINAELWSDHATAERWLAIPDRAGIAVDDSGRWKAPEGTVLARTVSMEFERGKPETRRRLETQILHFEEGSWRPYTYLWKDDQSDATLVAAVGESRTLKIKDDRAPGGQREQSYRVHARSECVLCHNPWVEARTTVYGRQSASPLAFGVGQLNREVRSQGDSKGQNQILALRSMGLLASPATAEPKGMPRLADPTDRKASLESRARAYLEVNCAHCHQFGAGGSANIVLTASTPLEKAKLVDERPMQGAFGIDDGRIVVPGDPEGSVLYYRIAKLGGGRMPRIGSNFVDEAGVSLIHDWIAGLGRAPKTVTSARSSADATLARLVDPSGSTPKSRAEAIRSLADSTRGGLRLMRWVDQGHRALVLEIWSVVKDSTDSTTRDLFERFVPDSDRVKRLGDRIDGTEILALAGDPARGARLFAAPTTLCATCHRVGSQGVEVGPDLDVIGSKYDRPTLLRQILEPSAVIEEKYRSYVLETKGGLVHSGMLVAKDAREVVLKDSKNQPIRVPAGDVESLRPQSNSLMPESLLRVLSAREAADLLDYLASLKAPTRPVSAR
jgi:uncharacterized repeat protein (TIGR03806 family)